MRLSPKEMILCSGFSVPSCLWRWWLQSAGDVERQADKQQQQKQPTFRDAHRATKEKKDFLISNYFL